MLVSRWVVGLNCKNVGNVIVVYVNKLFLFGFVVMSVYSYWMFWIVFVIGVFVIVGGLV